MEIFEFDQTEADDVVDNGAPALRSVHVSSGSGSRAAIGSDGHFERGRRPGSTAARFTQRQRNRMTAVMIQIREPAPGRPIR
jgi:hypothetical protein